jgi:plasmid maintenance system antidote protein VapI
MAVEFGLRVQAYMQRADLSQRRLGRELHIRPATISKVIKGDLELSPNDAVRVAKSIKVPSVELIEFTMSSQGFSNSQIEQIQGTPLRDLDNIRHAKRKLFDSKGRQFGIIRY